MKLNPQTDYIDTFNFRLYDDEHLNFNKMKKKKQAAKNVAKKKTKKVGRSAISGKFVSKKKVKSSPKTTYTDTVPTNNDERIK